MFKPVKGYEGLYEVSEDGRVRSISKIDRIGRLKTGKMKSACDNGTGYLVVNLKVDGKSKMKLVHRLVAEAFIPNPENKPTVNHINGDKTDNRVENLEWATRTEQMKHAIKTGLLEIQKGSANSNAKLTDEQVKFIRANYKPYDLEFGFEALARKFGCSSTVIKHAAWGDSYALVL